MGSLGQRFPRSLWFHASYYDSQHVSAPELTFASFLTPMVKRFACLVYLLAACWANIVSDPELTFVFHNEFFPTPMVPWDSVFRARCVCIPILLHKLVAVNMLGP